MPPGRELRRREVHVAFSVALVGRNADETLSTVRIDEQHDRRVDNIGCWFRGTTVMMFEILELAHSSQC